MIPIERVPPSLLEQLRSGSVEPVPAQPASTVVLLRDGRAGPETLLLRRPQNAGFASGAWVFPGGSVDVGDYDFPPSAPTVSAAWAARLKVEDPHEAWGYVLAAVRETWEETGILLGRASTSTHAARLRRDLLSGSVSFRAAAAALRFEPEVAEMAYIAHWITPEAERRRFDTRFFLAPVAAEAEPFLLGEELSESRWVAPGEAVAAFERSELPMLPPTLHTLRRFVEFGSVGEALDGLRNAPVPALLPRIRAHLEGVEVTLVEES